MRVEGASATITLVSAVLAGVVIYYSRPITKKFVNWMSDRTYASQTSADDLILATVESANGSVVIRRLSGRNGETARAQTHSPIYHLDQVIVDRGANTILHFASGYRLRFLPDTEATIQSYRPKQASAPALVTITSGDYQLLSRGREGQLFIALNNQIFAPEFRPPTIEAPHLMTNVPPASSLSVIAASDESSEPDKLTVDGHETLSNEYIERVMRQQAGAFQHCQMNSIRDNLAVQGSLLFSMTISPTGQITHLHVLQDMLNNKELLECTRSVLERLQFEPFNGDPMTVNYPIDYR